MLSNKSLIPIRLGSCGFAYRSFILSTVVSKKNMALTHLSDCFLYLGPLKKGQYYRHVYVHRLGREACVFPK